MRVPSTSCPSPKLSGSFPHKLHTLTRLRSQQALQLDQHHELPALFTFNTTTYRMCDPLSPRPQTRLVFPTSQKDDPYPISLRRRDAFWTNRKLFSVKSAIHRQVGYAFCVGKFACDRFLLISFLSALRLCKSQAQTHQYSLARLKR